MTIPDYESIMLPLLKLAGDGNEHSIYEAEEYLFKFFDLTDEERKQLKPSGRQTTFFNRIGWARLFLKKAGLLFNPQRGYFKITEKGLNVLKQNLEKIDSKFLSQFPGFTEFRSGKEENNKFITTQTFDVKAKSPEDMMISGYQEIRNNLENELLTTIKERSPKFFEKLITELMVKMGYGLGTVTGKSGDGGVDAIIKEDKLGLGEIYLQAKRWEGTVPAKEVRDFAGALQAKKSKKGIFITTSDFSNDAKEFVKSIPSNIRLINGEQLARYMVDYGIGVKTADTYEIKKIDDDFFDEQ